MSGRGSAISASPRSAAVAGLPASATKRLSRAWCGRLHRRPLEDLAVQAIGFVGVSGRRGDPSELDTCLGRDPRRLGCLGCRKRLPLELLGLAQIAVRESDRAESGESERRVVAEPDSPGELERAPVRIRRGRLFPASLGRPRLEQQHRGAKRVVADRVRVTAGDRGRRGDGRDVAGVRRTDRANEAARCDAPVVSGRLERGGRVVRHRGSAFDVARLPKGEREHQLREAALPWCAQRSRQARPRVRRPRARRSRSNSSVAM